jgi:hypothetical protein
VHGVGSIGIVTPPLTRALQYLGCSDSDLSFRFEPDSADAQAHPTARESHDQSYSDYGFADPAGNSHKSGDGSVGESPSVRMLRMPLEAPAMLSSLRELVQLQSQTAIAAPL